MKQKTLSNAQQVRRISEYLRLIEQGAKINKTASEFITEQRAMLNSIAKRIHNGFESNGVDIEDCRQTVYLAVYDVFNEFYSKNREVRSEENYIFKMIYYRSLRLMNTMYSMSGVRTTKKVLVESFEELQNIDRLVQFSDSVKSFDKKHAAEKPILYNDTSAEDEVVEEMYDEQMKAAMRAALQKLPQEERTAVELTFLRTEKKQTVREVAAQMGVSKSYVSVLVHKGLETLKEELSAVA